MNKVVVVTPSSLVKVQCVPTCNLSVPNTNTVCICILICINHAIVNTYVCMQCTHKHIYLRAHTHTYAHTRTHTHTHVTTQVTCSFVFSVELVQGGEQVAWQSSSSSGN